MTPVTISRSTHKGEERIVFTFEFNKRVNDLFKQIQFVRYSATLKKWHIPFDINLLKQLKKYNQDLFSIENFTVFINEEFKNQQQKKELKTVYTKKEIEKIINSGRTKKEKTILALLYFCGLRLNELIFIKVKHLNSKNKTLMIVNQKGYKDRAIGLNNTTLELIINYYKSQRPTEYLFESPGQNPCSSKLILDIYNSAVKNSGVKKISGVNTLRHSYAVHLYESGTDIVKIKNLLGQKNIETTKKYLGKYYSEEAVAPDIISDIVVLLQ